MDRNDYPTVNIVIDAAGVKTVQFIGSTWKDEEATTKLYSLIRHLIQEMDHLIKREFGNDAIN